MFNRNLCLLKCRSFSLVKSSRLYTTTAEINEKMQHVLNTAAVNALGSKATLKRILQLAQELRLSGETMDSKTFEHILSAYAKAGDNRKALLLHKQLLARGEQPEKSFYQKALHYLGKDGDAVTQAKLLHQMEFFNYPKTSKIYASMFLCMRENLELERALDTLDVMKKQSMQPSLLSYLDVLDIAFRLEEPTVAYDLLQEIEKFPEFHSRSNGQIYMNLLRSAAYSDNHKVVLHAWTKAVNEYNMKPDEGLLLYVLNVAGKHNDPKLATDAIRIVGESGFPYKESHFMPLIEAFASTGDMKNTFKVFTAMRNVGVIPNKKTALPVVHKLGSDKNAIRQARAELDSAEEVDVSAFNLVIHALAHNKEYDEAISLFRDAERLGVKPNSETLDAALDVCIYRQDADLGKSIHEKLTNEGVKETVTTLSKMVTLMCTQEDYEDAFIYLEKMKQLGMTPLRGCYFKLVKTLSKAADSRLSLALDDMAAYGYPLSTHLTDYMEREERKQSYEQSRRGPIYLV